MFSVSVIVPTLPLAKSIATAPDELVTACFVSA